MADDYLPGGVEATPPPALVRVKEQYETVKEQKEPKE